MEYFINSAASNRQLSDVKVLIPDANLRRRMSYVLKMGVSTAMECIHRSSNCRIDAIITAMGLGCLSDSEKFLRNILESNEQMLNPTPFIQSTFNTIGGQIALLTGNRCYNMTYSHRRSSFDSALLDGLMKLEEGANDVLVGAADEQTPSQTKIMQRLGVFRTGVNPDEGAHFFIVGSKPCSGTLAIIEKLYLSGQDAEGIFDLEIVASNSYFTASAEALWNAVEAIKEGHKRVLVKNSEFKMAVKCF